MDIGPLTPTTHRLIPNPVPGRMDPGVGACHAKLLPCYTAAYSHRRYPLLQKSLLPLPLVWVHRGEHIWSLAHRPAPMVDSISVD